MFMNLPKDSVAVVTGAASGIGRALSIELARLGAAVAIADVNESALTETARLAEKHGVKVSAHLVDVSDKKQMEDFAKDVLDQHGRATHLINNAGVAMLGNVEELSIEDIEWLMGINFWGVVYGIKFFLPTLKQQNQAHIVNISSVFGLISPAGQSAYSASKFAVRGFSEALTHELEGTNVFVSTVHPGGIKTNIARTARVGKAANPKQLELAANMFDKVAITPPEKAAEIIIRGMIACKPRILIGTDARVIDTVQRLMPVHHWAIAKKRMFTPRVEEEGS
jgi:short-subunit dehydrogenase